MKLMNVLFAIVLVASMLDAQPEPVGIQEAARAKRLLSSSLWAKKAWGAYIAGRLHSGDLREPLIDQFRSVAVLSGSPHGSDEHAFITALFDAAIEAGIQVPAKLLDPFMETWTAPVLILLARDPNCEDRLLALRRAKSRDMAWLAANNLLFERKSQRWYAETLGEITVTHRFVATDRVDDQFDGIGICVWRLLR